MKHRPPYELLLNYQETFVKFFYALILTLAVPLTANAYSAIAIATTGNIAKDGIAQGFSSNHSTRAEAEEAAIQGCKSYIARSRTNLTPDMCHVVAYFDNQFLAISMDPAEATPGWGWAIAATAQEAMSQAINHCMETAGNRARFCETSVLNQDTTP